MPVPNSSHDIQPRDAKGDTNPVISEGERLSERAAKERDERLAEVRAELAALVATVKAVTEGRAAQTKAATMEGAQASVAFTRNTIRTHPFLTMTAAAAVGAAIALMIIPTQRRSRIARSIDRAPDVARSSLGEMAHGLQQTASATGSSVLSAFERVLDSIATIDPKPTLGPPLDMAASWLRSLRGTSNQK